MKDKSETQKLHETVESPKDNKKLKIPQNELWAFIVDDYKLCLRWDTEGSFSSGITFTWRKHVIHFKFILSNWANSTTYTQLIRYKDEDYRSGVGRSAHGAGCFGTKPNMETDNNYLEIVCHPGCIVIRDLPKSGEKRQLEPGPFFEIISIPNLYKFDNRH